MKKQDKNQKPQHPRLKELHAMYTENYPLTFAQS